MRGLPQKCEGYSEVNCKSESKVKGDSQERQRYETSAGGAAQFSPHRKVWVTSQNCPERRRCDTALAAARHRICG